MIPITRELLVDVCNAVTFLTRVPMPQLDGPQPATFVRAQRAFPLVGAAIGLVVGLVYLGLLAFGLPNFAAAALTLGAGALLTGALHEDGLADMADGFGGGRDRAAKLAIMRDSRLGTYGAITLMVSFTAKFSALATLPTTLVVPALVACHALARGFLPTMMIMLPSARQVGLAAAAGTPTQATAAIAAALAFVIAALVLPWTYALSATLVTAACAIVVGWLALRQIGGHTGDVLGAAEQVAETAILLLLSALAWRAP
jgi:adenosylcobinamide-GDP ribazoletransferase